jgi:hypothetical protein
MEKGRERNEGRQKGRKHRRGKVIMRRTRLESGPLTKQIFVENE